MVFKVKKQYCRKNLVQVMPLSYETQLIIDSDGVILLKIGDKVVINKYRDHLERYYFPFSDHEQSDNQHFNELFEFDKNYLNYNASRNGINLSQLYFTSYQNEGIAYTEELDFDGLDIETFVLKRNEIEDFLNPDRFSEMYILDINGKIRLAKSLQDNLNIGTKIIPSDEEIVEEDFNSHLFYESFFRMIDGKRIPKEITKRPIEEVKDIPLENVFLGLGFKDILITVEDGELQVYLIKIDFLEKDKFRLTRKRVPLKKINSELLQEYVLNNEVPYTNEPFWALESEEEEKIERPKTFFKKLKANLARKK